MDNRLLTLGQAAFLVLSDRVNKPESKEIWVDDTHKDTDELETPYPQTPPSPDTKASNDEGIMFKENVLFDGSLSDGSLSDEEMILDNYEPDSNATASIKCEDINDKPIVSKKRMLSFAKMIFSLHKPHNFRHDYMFITPDMQHRIITSHLDIGPISISKLSSIITKDDFISFMSIYKGAKGRWLYVLREPHRDALASEINQTLI